MLVVSKAGVGILRDHGLAVGCGRLGDQRNVVLVGAQRFGEVAEKLCLHGLIRNHGGLEGDGARLAAVARQQRLNRRIGRSPREDLKAVGWESV